MNETSSGAFLVNEALMHAVNENYGFGGVGGSGYGRYGGFEGFKSFSNAKSVMIKRALNFGPFKPMTPPFSKKRQEEIRGLAMKEGS